MADIRHIDDGTSHAVCDGRHLMPLDMPITFRHAVNLILGGNFLLPCASCWAGVLTIARREPARFFSEERVR